MTNRDWHSNRTWPCECGSGEYVTLSCMNLAGANAPDDWYCNMLLEAVFASPDGWWQRVGAAWQILRRRSVCRAEVLLRPETAREIAAELTKAAELLEKATGG